MVDLAILLSKCQRLGIRGVALKWLSSYLSGRIQNVEITTKIGKCLSDPYEIAAGVPQGSVLGPSSSYSM
jgi:hypothetical protein